MGVLTVADGVALALLCDALVDFLHAAAIVKEEGCIARTDKGVLFQHPAVGVKNKAWERVVKVLREFGMTPTSRPGIHATGKREKGDPKDKFFKPRLGVVG
jgi:P27 family predicted phage terminase small subunit